MKAGSGTRNIEKFGENGGFAERLGGGAEKLVSAKFVAETRVSFLVELVVLKYSPFKPCCA
jgi:hypothetical protein